jgi:hypothetical protein
MLDSRQMFHACVLTKSCVASVQGDGIVSVLVHLCGSGWLLAYHQDTNEQYVHDCQY